eukprot:CAMPEP_0175081300 /NCGR_PEP_ID=MMETSP0052_2-20121109/26059_1 /TAXON_ID=51329 ORGANISM="Polytomella parva, Strain SAG 63-3" /NCGR_SAMPLE_ID=MMETSP0052_2 /ASSEMBLY_ACC=CAM_ASM_000194 /LENGTH=141 /DNA_ID=CAMNT_0016352241 /DNA_START=58 /DNA_END=484 /DNA_ORIENTATION=+
MRGRGGRKMMTNKMIRRVRKRMATRASGGGGRMSPMARMTAMGVVSSRVAAAAASLTVGSENRNTSLADGVTGNVEDEDEDEAAPGEMEGQPSIAETEPEEIRGGRRSDDGMRIAESLDPPLIRRHFTSSSQMKRMVSESP